MKQNIIRALLLGATVLSIAACTNAPVGPAGQPSSTNVNPETGSRGGSGTGGSGGGTGGASASH